MNKKFLLGLSSASIAMSFVACGSGEVNGWTYGDENALVSFVQSEDSSLANLRDRAIKECSADPACAAKMGNVSNPTPSVTSSASVLPSSSASIAPISSSSIPVLNLSSSSFIILPDPESSAGVIPSGQYKLGTCAPVSETISKGGSTKWKFDISNENEMGWKAFDMIDAEFSWSFDAGATASGKESGFNSPSVEYSTSGKHSASLKITKGTVVESITCSPLQVNGAPITGCKCAATSAKADVADGGLAGWTIDGCTSVGQNITSYTWSGAEGNGQSASYTFTEKGQTAAPSVTVENDDNTAEVVKCDEVKAVDASSPDYPLEVAGDQVPQKKIEVANEGCITISGTWSNEYYHPTLTVSCDAKGSNVNLVISYGTESVKGSGDYGVNNIAIPLGVLNAGAVSFQNVCISLTGADVATCGLGTK